MKVQGKPLSNAQDLKAAQSKSAEELKKDSGAKGVHSNQTDNSVKTTLLVDKMRAKIEAEPEVRADKVAALKAQIKDGTYQVDSHKLAGNMILDGLRDEIL